MEEKRIKPVLSEAQMDKLAHIIADAYRKHLLKQQEEEAKKKKKAV